MKHDVSEVGSSAFFRQRPPRPSYSLSLGSIIQSNVVGTSEKTNADVRCGQFGNVRLKLSTYIQGTFVLGRRACMKRALNGENV